LQAGGRKRVVPSGYTGTQQADGQSFLGRSSTGYTIFDAPTRRVVKDEIRKLQQNWKNQ
jgi:hypothetical protein